MNRTSWIVVLVVLTALVPASVFLYDYVTVGNAASAYETIEYVSDKPKEMVVGSELLVKACKVIDGHIFVIKLENGQVIDGRLKVVTKDEATPEVVKVLKAAGSPSVVLRRKIGSYWVVDFNLTTEAKRITLVEWLEGKRLTL